MRQAIICAAAVVFFSVAVQDLFAEEEVAGGARVSDAESVTEALKLGSTRDEVLALFGEPGLYYASEAEQYFSPEEYPVAARIYAAVWAVYNRKTVGNEYEIRIRYDADPRESRLHPEVRVDRVRLIIDRPVPAAALLDDLAGLGFVPASDCSLFAVSEGVGNSILVVPEDSTPEQRGMAAAIATGWKPNETDGRWVPCLELELEKTRTVSQSAGGAELRVPPVDWLSIPVEEAVLHPTDMDFHAEMGSRYKTNFLALYVFLPLGTWGSEGYAPVSRQGAGSAGQTHEELSRTVGGEAREPLGSGAISGTLTYHSKGDRRKKPDSGSRVWLLRAPVAESLSKMTGERGRDLIPGNFMVLGGDGTLTLGLVDGTYASYPYTQEAVADDDGSFLLKDVPSGQWVVVIQSGHVKDVTPRDLLGRVICVPVDLEADDVVDVDRDFGEAGY